MKRIRVKICGITNLSDALLATDLGADALGFVFHRPSPRYIEPARAHEIARALPPFVTRVGVFVGATAAEAATVAESAGLDLLQIHAPREGEVPAGWTERWLPVFSPGLVQITSFEDDLTTKLLEVIRASGASSFLLDNASSLGAGGTGKPVDWTLAAAAGRAGKMVLAGGLTPANVATAIAATNPYGVDVSSGVERRPGIKDPMLMEEFFGAVGRAGAARR